MGAGITGKINYGTSLMQIFTAEGRKVEEHPRGISYQGIYLTR
jgi:hypothetical protein